MAARVKRCKQRLFWDQDDWKKVLFIYESMFCVAHGNQGICVWRLKQESYYKECLKHSVKFATSVVVWGCMTAKEPGRLCIVFTTVNSEIYQEILEHFMIPSAEDLCDDYFLFQQASFYTSKSKTNWLKKEGHNCTPLACKLIQSKYLREVVGNCEKTTSRSCA